MGYRLLLASCSLALGGAAAWAIAAGGEPPASAPPAVRPLSLAPLPAPDGRVLRDRRNGLRVTVPRGWDVGRESLTPDLGPPGSLLALGSFPLRVDRRRACGNWPDMPQTPVGPHDVLMHVQEDLDAQPGVLPRRPTRLRLFEQLRRARRNGRVRSVFPWRCLSRRGIAGLYTAFRAHGRWLALTAVAGERTTKRMRRELLGAMESLRVGPPPIGTVRVSPRVAEPGTPVRLEIVARERAGRRGRRQRAYWARVRGPARTACVIEHDAFFGFGPPGARLRARLDPNRTKGGRWCRGRFRGVVRYRDGYVCPPTGTCRPPGDYPTEHWIAGRFSFTVR